MVYTSVCCGAALAVLCVAGEPAVLMNMLLHWKKGKKDASPFRGSRISIATLAACASLSHCVLVLLVLTAYASLALCTLHWGPHSIVRTIDRDMQWISLSETRHACVFIYQINLDITLMKYGCPLVCFFFVLSFLLVATFWCSHPCSVLVYYRLFLNKCSKLRWQVGSALSRDSVKCYTAMHRAQGLYHLISRTTTLWLNSALLSR